jgi:tetratricopeptide (TPR) repeat protein
VASDIDATTATHQIAALTTLLRSTILIAMKIQRALLLTSILMAAPVAKAAFQSTTASEDAPTHLSAVTSLGLPAPQSAALEKAMNSRDYVTAEKLLLAEIARDPKSASAGRLLAFIGNVYFLNHDYLNAAIAWKKSDAITPLDPILRFSLAMAYIQIRHPDWATPVLATLAQQSPRNALFPYWLGRLDYDAARYDAAILHFQRAVELDPSMARAYDNLGLCYYSQNQNERAIEFYKKAIELERGSAHPSPWPYLNLAATQQFLGQQADAEANLREALRIDASLAPAHFQLGKILESSGRLQDAVVELQEAARLDPSSPEPHAVLARIYHKLGQEQASQGEVEMLKNLKGQH